MHSRPHALSAALSIFATLLCFDARSHAQSTATNTAAPAQSPADLRARYALPWIMRPAIAPTLARVETAINARRDGASAVTLLTAGAAIIPAKLGLYARLGVTHSIIATNSPATNGIATGAVANPLVFALFTPEIARGLRLALALAATIPIGTGGGDAPSPLTASSIATGPLTRSAMDNALFAVNYAAVAPGVSLAYLIHGVTFQIDLTVFQLVRTRGERSPSASDAMRTNFTSGLSVGYLAHRMLTVSAELHYQHWISAPNLLSAASAPAPNQLSGTIGLRANLALSRTVLARPGIALSMGFGGAMADRECKIVHIDLPITF